MPGLSWPAGMLSNGGNYSTGRRTQSCQAVFPKARLIGDGSVTAMYGAAGVICLYGSECSAKIGCGRQRCRKIFYLLVTPQSADKQA